MTDVETTTTPCPNCNGTMAIMQTIDGPVYICGECRNVVEIDQDWRFND